MILRNWISGMRPVFAGSKVLQIWQLVTMMMTTIKMVMEAMLMIKMMTMEMKSHSKTANKVVSSGSARRWQETSRRYSLKDNEACLWWSWTG